MAQNRMGLSNGQKSVGDGTSASTAAAVDITLGFKPKYVKVVVVDTNCITTEWIAGMASAKGIQYGENTGYKAAELASKGITVSDTGFTIGTSAQVNAKKYYWVAEA